MPVTFSNSSNSTIGATSTGSKASVNTKQSIINPASSTIGDACRRVCQDFLFKPIYKFFGTNSNTKNETFAQGAFQVTETAYLATANYQPAKSFQKQQFAKTDGAAAKTAEPTGRVEKFFNRVNWGLKATSGIGLGAAALCVASVVFAPLALPCLAVSGGSFLISTIIYKIRPGMKKETTQEPLGTREKMIKSVHKGLKITCGVGIGGAAFCLASGVFAPFALPLLAVGGGALLASFVFDRFRR